MRLLVRFLRISIMAGVGLAVRHVDHRFELVPNAVVKRVLRHTHDLERLRIVLAQAERFAEPFRAVYLTFHRRDQPRNQLAGASRAVLEHLALAGPLIVGEAATH